MTTSAHTDWKVTIQYRILLRLGWGLIGVALYLTGAAAILDVTAIWWTVAGLAVLALLTGVLLPEPVPRSMLSAGHNRVTAPRKG
jgi:hypothetical protein